MEEEGVVKAPITRLRRRLSVEQGDETKSPATPSTPTKKRGRLAAKPLLDLIDENTPIKSPIIVVQRMTNKTASLTVENEEKPLTPARRSTRVKSNTSIVSETTQTFDSPRAKRAARRTSQIGSDNEAPVTPVRQTRRTRKDSASSVENQVDSTSTITTKQKTKEVIPEEPDIINNPLSVSSSETTVNDNATNVSPTPRKSPRLLAKKDRRSSSVISNESVGEKLIEISETSSPTNLKKSPFKGLKTLDKPAEIPPPIYIIPPSEHQEKSKKAKSLNKSTSALEDNDNLKSKRYRTKSWTHLSSTPTKDNSFCSDNESNKKKVKETVNEIDVKSFINDSASGDHSINSNKHLNKSKHGRKSISRRSNNSTTEEKEKLDSLKKSFPENDQVNVSDESNKENANDKIRCDTEKMFEKAPDMLPLVFIEDSDSNTDSTGKLVIIEKQSDCEDQCVPVVERPSSEKAKNNSNFSFNKSKETKSSSCFNTSDKLSNDGCEPMDIDETLPDSISNPNVSKKVMDNSLTPKGLCTAGQGSFSTISHNKSQRKSLISNSITYLDTEQRNNKSMILSDLKDLSQLTKSSRTDKKNENGHNISEKKSSILNASSSIHKAFKAITDDKNDSVDGESVLVSRNDILSKSLNVDGTTECRILTNKNVSLNNLTGTPLNKKSIQLLGIQTSTPVISMSTNKKHTNQKTNKNMSITSQDKDESQSSDDEKIEESSKSKNYLIDEAEEASEDYESGDSQDDEERQYERDNEIVEKGETLTSDDEVSNESDYEKDSFIVSSDESDNDLLSGSGDDLSMSDNELSMSHKSKKKYNERKAKEQKLASREMFEARHGLDSSNNSLKTSQSKNKRNRLDSSKSVSEDSLPKKKNNRLRLDSTKDDSVIESDADEIIVAKKKKARQLSESLCNESAVEEKEITAFTNDDDDIANDPLCVAVKFEPKTPQKEIDISHINFTVREEVEEVHVNQNMSIDQVKDYSDPLEDGSNNETSSDDEDKAQIRDNYDSVLNDLNKGTKTKIKSHDLSLNVNKKSKSKVNNSVIDNLNLTQSNKTKKTFRSEDIDSAKISQCKGKQKNKNIEVDEDEGSSDSIDMHLLFPSDNEASTDENTKTDKTKNEDSKETLIPLKRTPGKTNIRESEDIVNEVSFFVDTMGDRDDINKSLNVTLPKKKNKTSISKEPTDELDSDEDAPTEISFKSEKNKDIIKLLRTPDNISKSEVLSMSLLVNKTPKSDKKARKHLSNAVESNVTEILDKTPQSQKKSKRLSQSEAVEIQQTAPKTPQSQKNKKRLSQSESAEDQETVSTTQQSQIKNKRLSQSESVQVQETVSKTPQSLKKNKRLSYSETVEVQDTLPKTPQSQKKNKRLSYSETVEVQDTLPKTPQSQKKNKRLSYSETVEVQDSLPKTPQSQKKNKRLSQSEAVEIEETETIIKTPKSQKKNKKKIQSKTIETLETLPNTPYSKNKNASQSESIEIEGTVNKIPYDSQKSKDSESQMLESENQNDNKSKSKKRKRTHSANTKPEADSEVISAKKINTSLTSNEKKKLKKNVLLSPNVDEENLMSHEKECLTSTMSKKKNKSKGNQETLQELVSNKKRKHRDEDEDEHKMSKVPKEHYSDKIHVARLPKTLISKLDEKPRQDILNMKKAKVVATANFTVDEPRRRKNKPSNYLEESVYLNDDSPLKKSFKGNLKKPKVLPFVPTAALSDKGFTTTFKVSVIPKETEFVAQSSNAPNFKNKYMFGKKIKRLGTYEMYKKQRNIKISKF